ncbi:hypothetical protein L2E82_11231 [Cichorium intybus]|uniref:Uncharacterized protein n=1 Tax=Cichorium intybus TaxID=13427 RepID=A0ACB9GCM2_CICIN|nr:hypothetical protein L2E82_11231 [Cichorium intybus]
MLSSSGIDLPNMIMYGRGVFIGFSPSLSPAVCQLYTSPKTHAARAFFVFGDSLVDNGNNKYLLTTTRADAPPYGIDYPTHRPTGRFSNGLNIPDLISQKLGAEPTLPYLSPELNENKLLVGANFASTGIGIGMSSFTSLGL